MRPKKPLLYFVAGILLIALLWSYLKQDQETVSEKRQALVTPLPTSKADSALSQIVRTSDSLPSELISTSSQKERIFSSEINDYLIRVTASFKKVIVPDKTYGVSLEGQEDITVKIDKNTLIAKAWYGFDKDNNLVRIQYKTIPLAEFNPQLEPGKKVSIGYAEKDYSQGADILLLEFVLLE